MTSPDAPITDEENPAQATDVPGVRGALGRFRVIAYVVGVGLLALTAAFILDRGFGQDQYMNIVGPVHGFLYILYLLAIVDLALKARWSMKGAVLVMLAGVVPFLSFVAERRVTAKVRAGVAL
jgi:integral membrane protein